MMVDFGVAELGLRRLPDRSSATSRGIADGHDAARDRAARCSPASTRATRNSGDVTRNAARDVAEAVGAEFLEFDVDALVQDYIGMVAERDRPRARLGDRRRRAAEHPGPRARARRLDAGQPARRAAARDQQPLRSGRRLRDDGRRHLRRPRPIAGIDKAFLRRWLRWMETHGPGGHRPAPGARGGQRAGADRRAAPADAKQTDEDDLMPYDLLDAIERAAIRDKQTPARSLPADAQPQFPQYTPQQLATWVERFFRLWCRNQWKRERYAPSFHLDDENLDPKTWCRFPILSGGFERELIELKEHLMNDE